MKNTTKIFLFIAFVIVAALAIYNSKWFSTEERVEVKRVTDTTLGSQVEISNNRDLSFTCDGGKTFKASYAQVDHSPGPDTIYIPETLTVLDLFLPNETLSLLNNPIVRVDSFSQYISEDKKSIFQVYENGLKGLVQQNGVITYNNCVLN